MSQSNEQHTTRPRSHAYRVLQRSWSHWTGGLWVTALVAFALPVWWRTMGAFESYAVLELKRPDLLTRECEQREKEHAGAAVLVDDLKLLRALPTAPRHGAELEAEPLTMAFAGPATVANALGAERYELLCRARDPKEAQLRCQLLTDTALGLGESFRMITAPTLPDKPVPVSRGSVVLAATGVGVLAGVLWMLGSALLMGEQKRPSSAPQGRPSTSSAPPPRPIHGKRPSLRVVPVTPASDDGASETLTELCRQVYLLATQGSFLISVSSWPLDREHKSRVAAQLAVALASERNARVLLIEADFEAPAVDRVTQVTVPPLRGFTQQMYLRGEAEQSEPWSVVQWSPSLSVLAEGRLRTPGLPKPDRLISATRELRKNYDIIVADAPVALRSADMRLIERFTDGVVFVTGDASLIAETAPSLNKWFGNKELVSIVLPEGSS